MFGRRILTLASVLFAVCGSARAGTVSIALKDQRGAPVSDAVVTLVPLASLAVPSHLAEEAVIDQRHQTFLPLVVVIRQGGRVVFTNNDDTMHQVYSFSPIKRFEFEIEKGHRSAAVVFDKAGIAAIGCNIHDNMIAYVFVSDAPIAAITDDKGSATAANVPPGSYRAEIWHGRLVPGTTPAMNVTVGERGLTIEQALSLTADKMSAMHNRHKQRY
jgi:plastocyanin